MSRRYKNFCKKLETFQMKVLTTEPQFLSERKMSYQCPKDHVSTLDEFSFNNKSNPKSVSRLHSFCADCQYIFEKEKEALEILEKINFTLLRVEKDPVNFVAIIYFRCVCGNESKSDLRNFKKKGKNAACVKCHNNLNKKDFEEIKAEFEKRNCVLLTLHHEYKNNKQLLDFQCVCGNKSKIILNDLKRGRLCADCKIERKELTCLERYGVRQIMQNPYFFKKCQESNFKRKPYTSPCGKFNYMILGYENRALDELFKTLGIGKIYAGEDKEIPVFRYTDFENKDHRYYPDIYIPSQNKIIEVKSNYTYNFNPQNTLCKALEVSQTHIFELWIYDERNLIELIQCIDGFIHSKIGGNLVLGEPIEKK